MEKSESIRNIAQAMLKFQKNMPTLKKDAENIIFKTKYASLSNILAEIAGPLADAELSLSQWPVCKDGLATMLVHAPTGEYLCSVHNMVPVADTPTDVGAALTYQRRYVIASILSLNIEDDIVAPTGQKRDDGVDDLRPWIEEGQYQKCLKRIAAGEKGVTDNAIKTFQMRDEVRQLLIIAEKKAAKKTAGK